MNRAQWFFIGLVFLLSCTEEEHISTRDYPFIESISAQSSEEGGATVGFEILKSGKATITSYGVEYSEGREGFEQGKSNNEKVEITGSPNSSKVTVNIKYELDKDKYYSLRPFVKVGRQVVYGNEMSFLSNGIHPPTISEISVSNLSGNTDFEIKGDYFSRNKNLNNVAILGLENYYFVEIIRGTNTELKLRAIKRNNVLPVTDEKFSLKVTSRGKSIIVPQHFSIQFPQILTMSLTRGHVGSTFTLEIDPLNFQQNDLFLSDYFAKFTPSTVPGIYNGVVKNVPADSFEQRLTGDGFNHQFSENFEVLNSWKKFRESSTNSQLVAYGRRYSLGDDIIHFNWGPDATIYLQKKVSGNYTSLNVSPAIKEQRFSLLTATFQNKYLFFGLGFKYITNDIERLLDFHRLDVETNEWVKLADFPFDWVSSGFGFEYQGKLVFVSSHPHFLYYQPQSDTWSDSQIPIPPAFKQIQAYTIHQDQIYYYSQDNTISRFRIGEDPVLFSKITPTHGYMGFETKRLLAHGDYLYFNSASLEIAKIDLQTGVARQVQSIFEISDFSRPNDMFPFIHNGKYFLGYPINSWQTRDIVFQLDLDD